MIETHANPIRVAILGSTGSIGTQALDVISRLPGRFEVAALAASRLSPLLLEQVSTFKPRLLAISTDQSAPDLPARTAFISGPNALITAATLPEVDIVLSATSGHGGIESTIAAIEAGKTIALANKETIVCAGELVMPLARAHGVDIRPVDSEHSALWQAIAGAPAESVDRLILTASGGPFRGASRAELEHVTREQTLAHPTWSMGGKVTVDSASLMNKGLEVIEARWLFDIPYEQIHVLVHPESIIHSIVEFRDASQIAQLSLPDMRLPIQYALTWPERLPSPCRRLSLADLGSLTFETPDTERFPALRLAREAGMAGNTYPTVLSAADDVAVSAFLDGAIRFLDIPALVSAALDAHSPDGELALASMLSADRWARTFTQTAISSQ
ncbi:MAG: 1-deoxy-D-xylulose-5-phosphate reductoisomerase, partial [Thermomicrobiales bacterium]